MIEPVLLAGVTRAYISAQYQTVLTRVDTAAGVPNPLLKADPRRWFVRFELGPQAVGFAYVVPGTPPTLSDAAAASNLPRESKWKDEVSATTGEWFVGVAGNPVLYITEVLYVGG